MLLGYALLGEEGERKDLYTYRTYAPGRGGERGAPPEVAVTPSKEILERTQAFSEVAATLANNHPEVKKVRKRYLGGRLLSDEEARAFLDKHGGPQHRLGPFWEKLLDKLVKTYRWREGDALWFVLTGHIPPVTPLEVRVAVNNTPLDARHNVIERAHGNQAARNRPTERVRDYHPATARITVTADAWVDAREIERVFATRNAKYSGVTPKRGGPNAP